MYVLQSHLKYPCHKSMKLAKIRSIRNMGSSFCLFYAFIYLCFMITYFKRNITFVIVSLKDFYSRTINLLFYTFNLSLALSKAQFYPYFTTLQIIFLLYKPKTHKKIIELATYPRSSRVCPLVTYCLYVISQVQSTCVLNSIKKKSSHPEKYAFIK